jgi:hypothetical protein
MPLVQTKGAGSAQGVGQFAQRVAANYIEDVFSTYLYTGNGSTQTITNGIDLSTKGGLVWIKQRPSTAVSGGNPSDHTLFDTNRGAGKGLASNRTDSQNNSAATLQSFGASGFTVTQFTSNGSSGFPYEANYNGIGYASWTFRKQAKFFDVVTYTGNGANRTIAHNLGSVPGCIMVKRIDGYGGNWVVYHRSLSNTQGLYLNTTNSVVTDSTFWNSTSPTSTNFSLGTSTEVNATDGLGGTYVAYLFAHDSGGFGAAGTDNVISCGSFTTDGSGNATVTLGWEPQWIMRKSSSSTATGWEIGDNMRDLLAPPSGSPFLTANTALAESSLGTRVFGPTATGFTAVGSPSTTYIYIAIRRGPMRTPTSGTSVFTATTTVNASFPYLTSGFPVDLGFRRQSINSAGQPYVVGSRLTGDSFLETNSTNAEASGGGVVKFDSNTGWYNFTSTSPAISWMLRRAPGFFDVVCYAGDGSIGRAISHNLRAIPELIVCKSRDLVQDGTVYSNAIGTIYRLRLFSSLGYLARENRNDGSGGNYGFNPTLSTSSAIVSGQGYETNRSGYNYIVYLFATVAGVSKVGSYTGTGTTQQINCGFSGGARFVLIKRIDSTGDWYVWDSARGIVAGNDPYLLLNSTAAEVTNTDYIDTLSTGFEISSTAPAEINANGGTFIFLAIA